MSGHLALYKSVGYRSSLVGLYTLIILLGLYVADVFKPTVIMAPPAVLPEVAAPISPARRQVITGKPVRITIPSLELDIPIADGVYNSVDGSWSLDFDNAFFALPSVKPNDAGGNTFIYGHSSRRIFGKLWRLKAGENVQIFTHNGHVFHYRYRGLRTVQPTDVSVFNYRGAPILTLQTCTGNWNELRRMYEFSLEGIT